MRWHDMDGWSWAWMTTMMVLVWGVIAVALLVVVRSNRSGVGQHGPGNAEEILDERLARGDIDIDEYQQRRDALRDRRQR